MGGAAGWGKKERRGEDEGRERGESRAELASLTRLLAHRSTRPPPSRRLSPPPPPPIAGSDRDPSLPSAPVPRR